MKKLSIVEKSCFALIGLVVVAIAISLIPKPKEPKKLSPELQVQYEKRMTEKTANERAVIKRETEARLNQTQSATPVQKKDYGAPPPVTGMNLPGFYANTRATMAEISWFKGSANVIESCMEWKKVIFGFNGQDRLNSIAFIPYEPIPLQHVRVISDQAFGVPLRDQYMFSSSKLCSFRKIPGLIQTVNCHGYKDEQGTLMVGSIDYVYNIEWAETASQGIERAQREFAAWSAANP